VQRIQGSVLNCWNERKDHLRHFFLDKQWKMVQK
jgi:hypothetical protein